jgi:predicted nicotinamide N-methyase
MDINSLRTPVEKSARNASIKDTFAFIERFVPIRDRRVYEIGSDRQFVSALEMMNMGAQSVTCTNVINNHNTALIEQFPNVSFQQIDAGSSSFEESSFDLVLVCSLKSGPLFELVPASDMELNYGQETEA